MSFRGFSLPFFCGVGVIFSDLMGFEDFSSPALEVVDSSKYLGVTISEDLTWKKHIDNTVNTANITLGFILGDCTAPVKAAAFFLSFLFFLYILQHPLARITCRCDYVVLSQY